MHMHDDTEPGSPQLFEKWIRAEEAGTFTLKDAMKKYERWRNARGLKSTTAVMNICTKVFKDHCKARLLSQVHREDVEKALLSIARKRKWSPGTLNKNTDYVVRFMRWCSSWDGGFLKINHLHGLTLGSASPKDRVDSARALTKLEWEYIKKYAHENGEFMLMTPDRRLCGYELAIKTGMRLQEQLNVTPEIIFVGKPDERSYLLLKNGKGGRTDKQYIDKELAERAHAYAVKFGKVIWSNKKIQPLARNAQLTREYDNRHPLIVECEKLRARYEEEMGRTLRDNDYFLAARDEENKRITAHSLRHSCATWMLQSGVAPHVVAKIMRHANPAVTLQRYAHVIDSDYDGALDTLGGMI